MGYNFISPGAAVSHSLMELLARRKAEERQAMLDALTVQREARADESMRANLAMQQAQLASLQEQRQAVGDEHRQQLALSTASMMQPGQDLSTEDITTLQDGRLGSLVQAGQPTLASTKFGPAADPQGVSMVDDPAAPSAARFRGTPAQLKKQQLDAELRALMVDPEVDDRVKSFVKAQFATGDTSLPYQLFAEPKASKAETQEVGGYLFERQTDGAWKKVAEGRTPREPQSAHVTGNLTDQQFRRSQQLESDFQRDSKDFIERTNSFRTMVSASKNVSPAGDISLVFAYMKMLDPGSVVREGEFATAQNAAGIPDRIRNSYNNLMKGERLNPTQRADFLSQAQNIFSGAKDGQERLKARYGQRAQVAGVPTEFVIYDYDSDLGAEPSAAAAGVGSGGATALPAGVTIKRVK